jgi:hypothetical protein
MCEGPVVCGCVMGGGVEFDGSMGGIGVAAEGWGCVAVGLCIV